MQNRSSVLYACIISLQMTHFFCSLFPSVLPAGRVLKLAEVECWNSAPGPPLLGLTAATDCVTSPISRDSKSRPTQSSSNKLCRGEYVNIVSDFTNSALRSGTGLYCVFLCIMWGHRLLQQHDHNRTPVYHKDLPQCYKKSQGWQTYSGGKRYYKTLNSAQTTSGPQSIM